METRNWTIPRARAVREWRGDALKAWRQRTSTISVGEFDGRIASQPKSEFCANKDDLCAVAISYGHRTRELAPQFRHEFLGVWRERRFFEPAAVQAAVHLPGTRDSMTAKGLEQTVHDMPYATTTFQNIEIVVINEYNHAGDPDATECKNRTNRG